MPEHCVQIDRLQRHPSYKSLLSAIEDDERKIDSLHSDLDDSKKVRDGRDTTHCYVANSI